MDVPVRPRNPGTPLDLEWLEEVRINRSAVERRAATLRTRRTVKKEWQAAWLLRAVTLMDLTTLSSDDTPGRVRRLCAKARQPVRGDLLEAMGAEQLPIRVAAVCVYHAFVKTAVEALEGSGIPVAAVSTGFPAGLSPFEQRIAEIHASVAAGAEEIDIVITRAHVLTGSWHALYDEVRAMREACGDAHIKTILAHRRAGHAAQRGVGEPGVPHGRRRLHQDLDRQGERQRDAARGSGDGARDPGLPGAHRPHGGSQARGRDPDVPGRPGLVDVDQGRAGRSLAPA